MAPTSDWFVGVVIYAVGSLILILSAVFLVRLNRTKGLKVGLAQLLTDPPKRRLFLTSLLVVLICLIVGGYLRATILVFDEAPTLLNLIIGLLWVVGALALLLLIMIALGAKSLSLHDEMRLEEDHPAVLESVYRGAAAPGPAKSSMYVVPPRDTPAPPVKKGSD